MKKDQKHIDHLIARYLSGEVSEKESLELQQWQEESKANKLYFERFLFIHEKTLASRKTVPVNVDNGWSSLKQKMASRESEKIETLQIPFYKSPYLKIAAMVIVVIGIALWFYKLNISSENRSKTFAVESHSKTLNQVLADHSQIFLNKNSTITYTSDFGKKNRQVTLKGEAYFDVKHDSEKPFVVKAEETLIKDIGTAFNIKAFPDSDIVKVFVENGEVLFFTEDNPGIKLMQGETGIYKRSTRSFQKLVTLESNVLSYKTKIFVFKNASLNEVVNELNSIYESNITLGNPNLSNCRITVTFENEDIDKIVGIIGETLGLKIKKDSADYILEGTGCTNLN